MAPATARDADTPTASPDGSIHARDLTKVYRVPLKEPGLMASLRSLWRREHREVRAVDGISLEIRSGERVGFLGPNGAGKTTTLKMLTGLLHPTSGSCEVAGHVPRDRDPDFLRAVTLVMGQKQQLAWDLPPTETFALNQALFDIPRAQLEATQAELVELLELESFLDQPVRNLSLGQRMRCELAASLLHRPRVLFLDEPTIGLDVAVQETVRRFIGEYNRRHGATVMLTSHDMMDVAAIAERIILIDDGTIRFDGPLPEFQRRFGGGRRVVVEGALELEGFTVRDDNKTVATVPPEAVNRLLAQVLAAHPEAVVTVEDPHLDEVLTRAFGEERGRKGARAPAEVAGAEAGAEAEAEAEATP